MKKNAELSKRNLIGRRVRTIRLSRSPSITLEDLAGRMAARGVTLDRSALGRIENGKRYVLDYEAVGLAKALKVRLRDLFGIE
ncbi:MAG TPA: helix-turn-helix transcriptional regulator [Opitutaceae bacterium]|nr:helix-turn-helix transcriptional regulator [Opitutaceae bacterium]